jgi:hypothetical protein
MAKITLFLVKNGKNKLPHFAYFYFLGESVTIDLSIGYTFNDAVQKLWPIKSKSVCLEGLATVATLQDCKTKQHWFQSLMDKLCLKFICPLLSPPLN